MAIRTKRTAVNNPFLAGAKGLFNTAIFARLGVLMNTEGADACTAFLRGLGLPATQAEIEATAECLRRKQ
jgi:hypothetical protein